jgi:hypothetical protein
MDERKLQSRGLANPKRRRFTAGLVLGLASLGSLAGCGGYADPLWEVAPTGALALPPGTSFNLATTLPSGVASGGVFEVDPSGSPLPPGVTLSPSGLLFVSGTATGGTAGVIFRYTPPA